MAFVATALTAIPRTFSLGPVKCQFFSYTVASGDTSGTITADTMSLVMHCIVDGPAGVATTAPAYATNVVTLTFVNPAATRQGNIIVFGI